MYYTRKGYFSLSLSLFFSLRGMMSWLSVLCSDQHIERERERDTFVAHDQALENG